MVVYNDRNFFGRLEYRFSSPPSQGGETGSTPVVAIENLDYMSRFFYLGDIKAVVFQVEPRNERRPAGGRGGMDAAGSECRRGGGVAHDVRSRNPSTPVVAIGNPRLLAGIFLFLLVF